MEKNEVSGSARTEKEKQSFPDMQTGKWIEEFYFFLLYANFYDLLLTDNVLGGDHVSFLAKKNNLLTGEVNSTIKYWHAGL